VRDPRLLARRTGCLDVPDLTHPDDVGSELAQVEAVLSGERRSYQIEKRYLRRDRTVVRAVHSASLVRAADGTPQHFIIQVQDMSERARLEAELRTLTSLDDLTGLWNRRSFERELAQQLRLVRRHREPAALLLIDLDGFKAVNDSFGQACGDALLQHVATILRSRLRESDAIARLGRDQFAILLPFTGAEPGALVADALMRALSDQPAKIGDATITAAASIGVALLDAELNVDAALRRADQAMHRTKREREREAGS
jgi:diguanylate cyclase (GGDEF)-like protein